MNLFKKRKKIYARTSHVHTKLIGRSGKPVGAKITSYPPGPFDDAYRYDLGDPDKLIFENDEGKAISEKKFRRIAEKKKKKAVKKLKSLKKTK